MDKSTSQQKSKTKDYFLKWLPFPPCLQIAPLQFGRVLWQGAEEQQWRDRGLLLRQVVPSDGSHLWSISLSYHDPCQGGGSSGQLQGPVRWHGLWVRRGGGHDHWLGPEAGLHQGRELQQEAVQGGQVLLCGQVINRLQWWSKLVVIFIWPRYGHQCNKETPGSESLECPSAGNPLVPDKAPKSCDGS